VKNGGKKLKRWKNEEINLRANGKVLLFMVLSNVLSITKFIGPPTGQLQKKKGKNKKIQFRFLFWCRKRRVGMNVLDIGTLLKEVRAIL
jgi:hypothetical protein